MFLFIWSVWTVSAVSMMRLSAVKKHAKASSNSVCNITSFCVQLSVLKETNYTGNQIVCHLIVTCHVELLCLFHFYKEIICCFFSGSLMTPSERLG